MPYDFKNTRQGIAGFSRTDFLAPPIILEQSLGRDIKQIFINSDGNIETYSGDMIWDLSGKLIQSLDQTLQEPFLGGDIYELSRGAGASASNVVTHVANDSADNSATVSVQASSPVEQLSNTVAYDTAVSMQAPVSASISVRSDFGYDLGDAFDDDFDIESGISLSQEHSNLDETCDEGSHNTAMSIHNLLYDADATVVTTERNNTVPNKKTEFACPHCEDIFSSEPLIRKHLSDEHHDKNKWMCSYEGCNIRSQRSNNLKDHELVTHLKQKRFFCSECFVNFSHHRSYEKVLHKHTCSLKNSFKKTDVLIINEPRFVSHNSGSIYYLHPVHGAICLEDSISLDVIKFLAKSDGSFFYCDEAQPRSWNKEGHCDAEISELSSDDVRPDAVEFENLVLRAQNVLQEEPSREVAHDNLNIDNLSPADTLVVAEYNNTGPIKKTVFVCPHCSNTFSAEPLIRTHLKKEHNDNHKWMCSYEGCDKKYLKSDKVREHEVYVHLKKKRYFCSACFVNFANSWHFSKILHAKDCPLSGNFTRKDVLTIDDARFAQHNSGNIYYLSSTQGPICLQNSTLLDATKFSVNNDGSFSYNDEDQQRSWNKKGRCHSVSSELATDNVRSDVVQQQDSLSGAQNILEEERAVVQSQLSNDQINIARQSGFRVKLLHPEHPRKESFVCECEKVFDHTEDKLFVEHLKREHKMAKPFVCRYQGCSRTFKYNDDRVRHESSVHLGIRYCCPDADCDYAAARKDDLVHKHIIRHHPVLYAEKYKK